MKVSKSIFSLVLFVAVSGLSAAFAAAGAHTTADAAMPAPVLADDLTASPDGTHCHGTSGIGVPAVHGAHSGSVTVTHRACVGQVVAATYTLDDGQVVSMISNAGSAPVPSPTDQGRRARVARSGPLRAGRAPTSTE